MRKSNLGVLLAVVFIWTLFIATACAADKFGYVDVLRVASEYSKTKNYNKKLEEKKTAYQSEVDKKGNEIKQLEEKINLLNEKEKETKKTELQEKYKTFETLVQQKQLDLRKQDLENTKEVVDDIKKTIKDFAEKKGYTFVFDERILLYTTKGMDISDQIISDLNSVYKEK